MAALEAIARRLLRRAHECALGENRKKIVPRYLMKAIETDPDLRVLLRDVRIARAGVMPTVLTLKRKAPTAAAAKKKRAVPKRKKQKRTKK